MAQNSHSYSFWSLHNGVSNICICLVLIEHPFVSSPTSCGGVGHILWARLESSGRQAGLVACSPFLKLFILFTGTATVLLMCLHQSRPSYSVMLLWNGMQLYPLFPQSWWRL